LYLLFALKKRNEKIEIINYGYIYQTINKENGIFYIGKFKGIFNPNYHGSGIFLKRAIDRYGEDKFFTQLIGYARTKKLLNEMEKKYIHFYKNIYGKKRLYNISNGGDGGPLFQGHKHSNESREKNRLSHLGKRSGMKDKCFPEEAKKAVSKANKGKIPWIKGKHHTNKTKLKISKALKGKKREPFTKEHIQNMIKNHVGMLGKVPWNKGLTKETDERLAKISENMKTKVPWNKNLNKGGVKI